MPPPPQAQTARHYGKCSRAVGLVTLHLFIFAAVVLSTVTFKKRRKPGVREEVQPVHPEQSLDRMPLLSFFWEQE